MKTLCCKAWIDWLGCLYADGNRDVPRDTGRYCIGGQDCGFGLWEYKVKE